MAEAAYGGRSAAGGGGALLVHGPPGVGKTCLVRAKGKPERARKRCHGLIVACVVFGSFLRTEMGLVCFFLLFSFFISLIADGPRCHPACCH